MLHVVWEIINILEIRELLSMAEDGYEFQINDGRISSVDFMEGAA